MFTDYYKLLGVSRNATKEEIQSAYRTLIKKNHPDRFSPSAEEWAEANRTSSHLNRAYRILRNPIQRRFYDVILREQYQNKVVNTAKTQSTATLILEFILWPVDLIFITIIILFSVISAILGEGEMIPFKEIFELWKGKKKKQNKEWVIWVTEILVIYVIIAIPFNIYRQTKEGFLIILTMLSWCVFIPLIGIVFVFIIKDLSKDN